jgi:hypothetical protein
MNSKKRDQSKWQEANINSILYHISKSRAKRKGIEHTITIDDIIIPVKCPILNIELDHSRNKGRRYNGASLDRIDSTKGYVKGNVQVISDLANRMKTDATPEQLLAFGEWVVATYRH